MKWAALGIAMVALAALFWIGGEQHYRGCVERANAVNPSSLNVAEFELRDLLSDARRRFKGNVTPSSEQRKAVDGCSHSPF